MTKKELKIWFMNKVKSCYVVKDSSYSDSIFLYYDEAVVRKMKICKLNNLEFKQDTVIGDCLFEVNFNFGNLWCDHDKIWSVFKKNYSNNNDDIREFISDILKEEESCILNSLFKKQTRLDIRPDWSNLRIHAILKEQSKMEILTHL